MITANHLNDWAKTSEAQRELPRLVRRLIHTTATTTEIAMPAGESTTQPGLDGELHSLEGNAWVSAGHSCWEESCRADVTAKANEDFDKRTDAFSEEYRAARTFVFVTARKWPGKRAWVTKKRALRAWADVRAYDADDLEQWLEQSPAVALALGEELGLTGPGVESPGAYLTKWGAQSSPRIDPEALLSGRDDQANALTAKIQKVRQGDASSPISVRADSVEEAVAFTAAALLQEASLAHVAAVVTNEAGWHFVDKNPQIHIAIAASPALAEAPTVRAGMAVIVPYASGDMARHFKGVAGRLDDPEMHLERPMHSEFEKALHEMGLDENDARRLSSLCGRSWSVFRRQHAVNPAIRRPSWLDNPAASALATVCLLGTWSSGKEADKEVVARISGKSYDDLEKELLELERLDDSPLLHIGTVWKAKSALELLALFGERITAVELDRFFREAEDILASPDPQLDLPEEERHAAAIHGKVRPISGLLLEALCDTLIKLAVRGPDVPALAARDIQFRVDHLVRNLLKDADRVRWLSLASQLPALAEASPNEFLSAIEASLAAVDSPVRGLLSETKGAGAMGRCWHAGLLWALETLAWAPQRLKRVSLILARLTETEIAGNWGNNPRSSLVDLYRSWFPQTGATVQQRIDALDFLIENAPRAAFKLIDSLVNVGHDTASPTSRPKWRDDDAGAGYGATNQETHQMLVAAADRQISMAKGDAQRVASLVKKYSTFDKDRRRRIRSLVSGLRNANDEEKEIVRDALRHKISWHRNYDDTSASAIDRFLAPLEKLYEQLTPADLIVRHAWLFKTGWPDLPIRTRDENHQERTKVIAEYSAVAVQEIFNEGGWTRLVQLAEQSSGWRVGFSLSDLGLSHDALAQWIVDEAGDLHRGNEITAMAGAIISSLPVEEREKALDLAMDKAGGSGRDTGWKVRLLVLCSEGPVTWARAKALGSVLNRVARACDC
ncbi:MAG: hypothetical protein QOD42_2841 [Sphingomonadales bacterium]|jgi:hypothetical protein|nr:hypothetical protein [Sphingomonadales bacterium]